MYFGCSKRGYCCSIPSTDMEATRQNFTSAYDHLLKILLVGDAKSNKRLLLGTYLEEAEMDQKSITTLGMGEVRL